ncbi:MAG: TetR/AcrR family transcriptional regulator [Oscillospiraceae bacterium]|nr:TetR/AcrR family transcriptional regulator [Oscillospiraceae bacterium]
MKYVKKQYSDREISIFEGMVSLLNQGKYLHELKVADIAAAAGMGKSTAYEYFSSKKDIIRESVQYHIFKEFEALSDFISRQDSFSGMIENAMDYIIDMLKTRFFSLLMMLFNLDQSELQRLTCEDNDMINIIQTSVNEQIKKILEVGKKEKLIGQEVTTDDCRIILIGIISAFSNEVRFIVSKKSLEDDELLSDLKKRTHNILLKALN